VTAILYFRTVKGVIKTLLTCAVVAVFLGASVNLYPCAVGGAASAFTNGSSSDSNPVPPCHANGGQKKTQGKEQKKGEKPCCTLHCYNPAHIEPLMKIAPPAMAMIALANEEFPFISLTFSPPLPPPRNF
jgi:hypothetical protein